MDADIQLGELEQSAPKVRLRPDRNLHYAVIGCYEPIDDDLPVFVDIDVMRDIETHALTNTNVELGGVLLGGQFHDSDGRAFVLITDSLRAEHYEATKGSFKFTHETWEAITRQRELFPDDLEMVGWYHTHPDWGVFLSGMDMFICDNFFNRPLDVALVVDPCRDDRGWFQWTGDEEERVRRTGGFYLIGSRFREEEILEYAELISGDEKMPANIRQSAVAGRINAPAAPVVNITDSRGAMQPFLIVSMLMMQFLFLAFVAWQMFELSADNKAAAVAVQTDSKSSDALRDEGHRELLSEIIAGVEPTMGERLLDKFEESRTTAASAVSDLEAQRITSDVHAKNNEDLKLDLAALKGKNEELAEKVKEKNERLSELSGKSTLLEESLTALQEDGVRLPVWKDWKMWTCGILLAIFSALIGFGAAIGLRKPDDEFDDDAAMARRDSRFDESRSSTEDGNEPVMGEAGDDHSGPDAAKGTNADGRISGINYEEHQP